MTESPGVDFTQFLIDKALRSIGISPHPTIYPLPLLKILLIFVFLFFFFLLVTRGVPSLFGWKTLPLISFFILFVCGFFVYFLYYLF